MSQRIHDARQHLNGTALLGNFMPHQQRLALLSALRGEEGEFFADLVLGAVSNILGTPVTYQTENVKSADKVLHLHYFMGGIDAWIVERDVGDFGDPNAVGAGVGTQNQAYGKVSLFGGGWENAEWGYISIAELIANGVELDLYWQEKTVKEMESV